MNYIAGYLIYRYCSLAYHADSKVNSSKHPTLHKSEDSERTKPATIACDQLKLLALRNKTNGH